MASSLTTSYQKSLAAALQQISPSLAALQNAKLHEKDGFANTLTCSHCGSFLIPGQGSIRLSRKTRRHPAGTTSPRMKLSCHVCSTIDLKPLFIDAATKAAFEPARTIGRRRNAASADGPERTIAWTLPFSDVSSTPSTPIARTMRELSITPDSGSSTVFTPPAVQPAKRRSESTERPPSGNASTGSSSALPSPSSTSKGGSSRKKKKSSLQEMLARNRLQRLQKQEERDRGGLLRFLDSA
ncbi:hypothetical protein CALCODRAFT_490433 [Calocera cornea HHB12733]|uniref:Rpr2-domain-containing protein n=1 Tax=Calocera cornea HHB12733 TaxID=1353952 RepID=A0A165JSU2_9BASI|nr:hypothetical protein CALCODRAFT_490433 [Calocera cornea HHB12733]